MSGILDALHAQSPLLTQLLPVLSFIVAAVFLCRYDIVLPRGDVVAVSPVADVIALLALGPISAMLVCASGVGWTLLDHRNGATQTGRIAAVASRTVSIAVAMLVDALVPPMGRGVAFELTMMAVVAIHLLTGTVAAQVLSAWWGGRNPMRAVRGFLVPNSALILAQGSAAVLGAMVHPTLGAWGLVLVVTLLLLIRQSYALLQGIREAYRTTTEVLVEAAEGAHSGRRGHAERTAAIARELATVCHVSSPEVERISYAALLHDIGDICDREVGDSLGKSSRVIEGVGFFDDVAPILRLTDGRSETRTTPGERDLFAAFVVALASDIDAMRCATSDDAPAGRSVERLAGVVPSAMKARAVGAALYLGHSVPAVS